MSADTATAVGEIISTYSSTKRWKPYPTYKDSDVEWLGEIPTHWRLLQLRRVIEKFVDYRGATPEKVPSGIPLITAKNIKNGIIDFELSQEFIKEEDYNSWMVRGFPEIDDVLVTTEAPLGESAQIIDQEIALAQRIILLKANKNHISNDYLKYYFMSDFGSGELWSRATGSTAIGIKAYRLKETLITAPSLEEQKTITCYIDRETAIIDTLISKKQRLIALLTEKCAALISHVVTKGLDPDVPLKESEIPTIGKIPNHWKVKKNKRIFKEINERSITGTEELLTVSHITGVTPRSEKNVNMFMAESLEGYKRCRQNDLIINTMWAWMGALGVSKQKGIVSPSYNVYRLINEKKYQSKYLDFLYRTPSYICEITRHSKGVWSSRLRLYPDSFFEICTIEPPLSEQEQILEYIYMKILKADIFLEKLKESIKKLREYRTALISAAVTGKIDIRNGDH